MIRKKKKLFLAASLALVLFAFVETMVWHNLKSSQTAASRIEKAYVAAETSGEIDVVDTNTQKVTKHISLAAENSPEETSYMPHNVQVSPNGKQVWVTGNAMSNSMKMSWFERLFSPKAYAHEGESEEAQGIDQVIVIDANTDKVIKRIDMGEELHLAHVVLTPDGLHALVTAQIKGAIYKINTKTYTVEQTLLTPKGSMPHGLRISPDGMTTYIAMNGSNSLGVLDIASFKINYIPLTGAAVQAAVSPDGKYAFATIYDKKSLAIYDIRTKKVHYVPLPADSKGPLQLYPTPDSRL